MPRLRTTTEAADDVGIDRATLQEWVRSKRVTAPPLSIRNGHAIRLWSAHDLKHVRDVKARTYRRGRGRKKAGTLGTISAGGSGKGRDEALNVQTCLNYRDYFLSLLAQGWGDVGKSLTRAARVEGLRAALTPLLDLGPYSFRLPPFIRATTKAATRTAIAETVEQQRGLNKIRSQLQTDLQSARDDHAQSKQALMSGVTEERDEALRLIHFNRLFTYAQRQDEWNQVQTACSTLETSLADQVAHYVQHQLLGFLKSSRRHARDAENIAGAMAGLPEWTASYSFQRCAKEPPQSPSANVEIFRTIASSWRRANGSVNDLVSILPQAIQAIKTDYVRMQLQAEWWYLLQAVRSIPESTEKEDVPFRAFSDYQKRRVRQTAETMIFAKEARLDAIRIS